jgi:hypothetical protein
MGITIFNSAVQGRGSLQLWMKAYHHEHGYRQDILWKGGGAPENLIMKLSLKLILLISPAPRVFRTEKYILKTILIFRVNIW